MIWFCLLVVIIVAIAASTSKKETVEEVNEFTGTVTAFSESSSGDMNGGYKSLDVEYTKDKTKVIATYASAVWHSDDDTIEQYYVSQEVFSEITKIINDTKLYLAEKLPNSEEFVCDGATTSVYVNYDDGKKFRYSTSQDLTKEVYAAEKEIKAVIAKYVEQGEKIPTVVPRRVYGSDYELNTEESSLHVKYSRGNRLYFEISNVSDQDITIDGKLTLYKLVDGKYHDYLVIEDAASEAYEAHSTSTDSAKLSSVGAFEPGMYKAVVGELEDVFEVK